MFSIDDHSRQVALVVSTNIKISQFSRNRGALVTARVCDLVDATLLLTIASHSHSLHWLRGCDQGSVLSWVKAVLLLVAGIAQASVACERVPSPSRVFVFGEDKNF